jgi:hypothetical protein
MLAADESVLSGCEVLEQIIRKTLTGRVMERELETWNTYSLALRNQVPIVDAGTISGVSDQIAK